MRRTLPAATALAAAAVAVRRRHRRRLAREVTGAGPGVVTDDGVRLHVESDGEEAGHGPVIVLVHGFLSSLHEFDAQRAVLRDRFRVVLYDHRGHGRSGWGGRRQVTLDRLGSDLGRVLDETTGRAPVVVVGHSLGGMAVMALAEQRPELFGGKIVGTALLSTSAGRLLVGVLPRRVATVLRGVKVVRPLVWTLWAVAPVLDDLHPFQTRLGRRWLVDRLFGPRPVPDWAVSRMESLLAGTSQSIAATFFPAMVNHHRARVLPAIASVPTLVLAGTEDAVIPVRHSRRIAAEIGPGADLVTIDGAGHMVNLTHADEVNDALLRLVEQVERAS